MSHEPSRLAAGERYRILDVLQGVDQSLCPGCTVEHVSPHSKVDVAVRNRKRTTTATPQPEPATAATTAQQEPAGVQPESVTPPEDSDGTPDEPGRTG